MQSAKLNLCLINLWANRMSPEQQFGKTSLKNFLKSCFFPEFDRKSFGMLAKIVTSVV